MVLRVGIVNLSPDVFGTFERDPGLKMQRAEAPPA